MDFNWKFFWARRSARKKGLVPPTSLIDLNYLNTSIDRSAVPGVLITVLVWATGAVLLTLSANRQRDLTEWQADRIAPFTIIAKTDFTYVDSTATAAAKAQAELKEPEIFRLNATRSKLIKDNLNDLFIHAQNRLNAIRNHRQYQVSDALPSAIAAKLSLPLLEALGKEYLQTEAYANYINLLRQLMVRGIIQDSDLRSRRAASGYLRTIDYNQRYSHQRMVSECPTPATAAELLANTLFPAGGVHAREFCHALRLLIGNDGNLDFEPELTAKAKKQAANQISSIEKSRAKGDLLVRKHDKITPSVLEMLAAEKRSLPAGIGLSVFYYRIAISLVLLLATLFFLYRIYPALFADPRQFFLGGMVIILALVANYGAINGFHYLFSNGIIHDYSLLIAAVPAVLGAALASALLGNRAAICIAFITSATTAMMVMPDRSFELAMRWLAVSILTALFVRNVTNYRSYFLRILASGFIFTLIVTADVEVEALCDYQELGNSLLLIGANSLICAIAALLLIFIFEVVSNVNTNMALMVLCDYNHHLLERLKREAPGTMFHSMSVATLAEDAAREIHVNTLKAKAGALFHDIGKLERPHYFTENNLDSSNEHLKLNPQVSSMVIRDHVKEGLILARKHRLCRSIREAIATHHGDDLVVYFYRQALEKNRQKDGSNNTSPVLESQFRYAGTPPRGKEATIISLADACEAACRSLGKPTPAKISAMVEDIFIKRWCGGQLRNSELSLAELDKIKACFITTLISINHGRIAYQPENINEATSEQLENPAVATSGSNQVAAANPPCS